jgi:hypothetical protein
VIFFALSSIMTGIDPNDYAFVNEGLDTERLSISLGAPPGAARAVTKMEATGSILIRCGWKARPGISGMAVLPIPSGQVARNRVAMLTDDTPPPPSGGAAQPLSTTMAAVIKDMDRMKDKWELLMPRVFLPASVRSNGTPTTIKIRHGDMVLSVAILDVDFGTQQVVMQMPASMWIDESTPLTRAIRMAELLRMIDVGANGAFAWNGVTRRLLTAPPEGVAFGVPPPPPPGPPPPMPAFTGPTVDISSDDPNSNDPSLRQYLTGLTSFGSDTDWTSASFLHIVDLMQAVTQRMPLSMAEARAMPSAACIEWTKKAGALLSIKFSREFLNSAASFSTDRTERAAILRSQDKMPTPHKATPPLGEGSGRGSRVPPRERDAPDAPPRDGASTAVWHAAVHRRGLLGGVRGEGADEGGGRMGTKSNSDDSDDDSDDEREAHPKRQKKKTSGIIIDTTICPTLSEYCPEDTTVVKFAKYIAQATEAGDDSASATISAALKDANIPSQRVWNGGPIEIAEAAISVAIKALSDAGITLPAKPTRMAAVPTMISAMLGGLQQIAMNGGVAGSGGRGRMGEGGAQRAPSGLSASALVHRPADDFERGLSHSTTLSHSILDGLRSSNANNAAWARSAKATSALEITKNAPLDVLRLQMTDKFTQKEQCELLAPEMGDAIAGDARARAAAAMKAIERCLRAKLPSDVEKKTVETLVCLKFSKMPSIHEISKESSFKDSFGYTSRAVTASSPVQSIAAVRAGLTAAWPEVDWTALLAAEDDIRGLLLGKHEAQAGPDISKARAGQLWIDVCKLIEKRADLFRAGTLFPSGGPEMLRDLVGKDEMHKLLDSAHEANLAATSLIASYQLSPFNESPVNLGGGGNGGGTSGAKTKVSLASLFNQWRQEFGNACIFHHTKGCSKSEAECTKDHESNPVDTSLVKAFCRKHNADCPQNCEVSEERVGIKPAPLGEVQRLRIAWEKRAAEGASAREHTPSRALMIDDGPSAPLPADQGAVHNAPPQSMPSPSEHVDVDLYAGSSCEGSDGSDVPCSSPLLSDERASTPEHAGSARAPRSSDERDAEPLPNAHMGVLQQRERHERSSPPPQWPKPLPPNFERHLAHEDAVMRMRSLPEGQAMKRAEASCLGEQGMYDPMRTMAEDDGHVLFGLSHSVLDRAVHTRAKPTRYERWCAERRAQGIDLDWRPTGDATTLFKEGMEYGLWEVDGWLMRAMINTTRLYDGLEPASLPELRQVTSDFLKKEADALQPWLIHGEFFDKPVPVAIYYKEPIDRGVKAVNCDYFSQRQQAGDVDQDICAQMGNSKAVDVGSSMRDTLLTWHLSTMWADSDILEKSIQTVDAEIESGAFRSFEGGTSLVPMYPLRVPPRFAVDEGHKPDGSRKIRSVVHYSHPKPIGGVHRYAEGSTNSSIDLSLHPELKLSSGRAFWRSVDPLTQSGYEVLVSKRDGKNAFRQIPTHPLDWWRGAICWPDRAAWRTRRVMTLRVCLDGAVAMGLSSAMTLFCRVVDVPARHTAELRRLIDQTHPPTEPGLIEFRQTRSDSMGEPFGSRLDTDDQFCDDSLMAGINDLIEIKHGLDTSPLHFLAAHGGTRMGREDAKLIAYDHVWEELLNMEMDHGAKRVSSTHWLETLGVEGTPRDRRLRYPARKVPTLIGDIERILNENEATKAVKRDELHTVVSKEKWMAHLALEANPLLASGWAVMRAPGGSTKVTLSTKCIADQRDIITILKSNTTMPLTPRSSFPVFESCTHILTFQDASTSTGAGGWALVNSVLHGICIIWPQWVLDGFAQRRWSISPAELWILRVVLRIVGQVADQRFPIFITAFTDNESARASANKLGSNSEPMNVIARDMAAWLCRLEGVCKAVSIRTVRVTTKENASADDASRAGGEAALQHLALVLGVRLQMHHIDEDDSLWELIRQGISAAPH